jgi:hypothetical protein
VSSKRYRNLYAHEAHGLREVLRWKLSGNSGTNTNATFTTINSTGGPFPGFTGNHLDRPFEFCSDIEREENPYRPSVRGLLRALAPQPFSKDGTTRTESGKRRRLRFRPHYAQPL